MSIPKFSRSLKSILVLLSIFSVSRAIADESDPMELRWESLRSPESVFVRPFVAYRSLGLALSNLGDDKSIEWKPNVSFSLGSDLYYRDFPALGFSYSLPSFNANTYGNTRAYDIRFEFDVRNRYYFQIDYQHYKGFFTRDAKPGPNPFRDPSLEINNVSVRNIFVFSPHKFSLEALRTQSKRQIRSGGSALSGIYSGWAQATSPNGLIPTPVQAFFAEDATLYRASNLSLLVRGGYGYNWIFWDRFFLGGYGLLGLGATQTQLRYRAASKRTRINLAADVNFFAAAGYTGDRFSSSLSVDLESIALPTSNATMTQKLLGAFLNVGWRF